MTSPETNSPPRYIPATGPPRLEWFHHMTDALRHDLARQAGELRDANYSADEIVEVLDRWRDSLVARIDGEFDEVRLLVRGLS